MYKAAAAANYEQQNIKFQKQKYWSFECNIIITITANLLQCEEYLNIISPMLHQC